MVVVVVANSFFISKRKKCRFLKRLVKSAGISVCVYIYIDMSACLCISICLRACGNLLRITAVCVLLQVQEKEVSNRPAGNQCHHYLPQRGLVRLTTLGTQCAIADTHPPSARSDSGGRLFNYGYVWWKSREVLLIIAWSDFSNLHQSLVSTYLNRGNNRWKNIVWR